jgi:hypothetical protein
MQGQPSLKCHNPSECKHKISRLNPPVKISCEHYLCFKCIYEHYLKNPKNPFPHIKCHIDEIDGDINVPLFKQNLDIFNKLVEQ